MAYITFLMFLLFYVVDSTTAYYYSTTTTTTSSQHYEDKFADPEYTDFTDVLFCLLFALGWTIWIFSSFIRSELFLYNDSILVKGHVLSCMMVDPELGTYKAVVDYKIPAELAATGAAAHHNAYSAPNTPELQIRKQFETNQHLKEGFHNVDVLVLPNEPTHSILREDWQMEVQESQLDGVPFWETNCCKRLSIGFACMMVLMSIGGSIMMVERLKPSQTKLGWLVVCLGCTFLIPTALLVHRCLMYIQRELDAKRSGVIVNHHHQQTTTTAASIQDDCDHLDVLDVRVCDDDVTSLNIQQTLRKTVTGAGCYWIEMPEKSSHSSSMNNNNDDCVSTVSSISLDRGDSRSTTTNPLIVDESSIVDGKHDTPSVII